MNVIGYRDFPYDKIIEKWNKDYYDGVQPKIGRAHV